MHITRQFLGHCHELHQGVTVSELWKRHPPYSVPDIFQLVELELGWRNYVQHLQAFFIRNFLPVKPMFPLGEDMIISSEDNHLAYDLASRRMNMLPLVFSLSDSAKIVSAAKENGVTVHCVLTAGLHLAMCVHSQQFLEGDRPNPPSRHSYNISLRQFLPVDKNYVLAAFGGSEAVLPCPSGRTDDLLLDKEIFWKIAKDHKTIVENGKKTTIARAAFMSKMMGMGNWKDFVSSFLLTPFGRRSSYNISNRGVFEIPPAGPFEIGGVWFGSTEQMMGPSFAHNIVTINKQLYWTIVWFSPFTSQQRTSQLRDNIEKALLHGVS
eukprot:TRINITY_DN3166_c0_g2_i9.p1 TRINITY_DN3166_c0_g2~~TRINITY_DN3166_c0_g2_i9.p1  ORF type:complete len:323 (-),score=68.18 TRINITY_DN3166_c0_g2_i9:295-1263(-)